MKKEVLIKKPDDKNTFKFVLWALFPVVIFLSQINLWYLNLSGPESKILNKFPIILVLFYLFLIITTNLEFKKVNVFSWLLLPIIIIFFVYMDKSLLLRGHPDKEVLFQNILTYLYTFLLMYLFRKKIIGSVKIKNITYSLIVLTASIYISSFLVISESHPYMANALNFMIVVHSLVQIDLGRYVFFDLYSQYGGYSLFFKPIFVLIDANVFNVSILFAVLNLICCIGIFLIIRKLVSDPNLQIIAFLSMLYLQYFAFTTWPSEKYYQVYPIRMVWPVVTALVVLHLIKRNRLRNNLYFAICSTFSILWNIETGLGIILALVLLQLKIYSRLRDIILNIFLYSVLTILTFFLIVLVLQIVIGQSFDLELFTRSLRLYPTGALLMLNKIWVLVLFVYGCVAILSYKSQEVRSTGSWFISWLAIGLFMYHLLRTGQHEATLSNVFWPFSICLALIYEYIKSNSELFDRLNHSNQAKSNKKNWYELTLIGNIHRILGPFKENLSSFLRPASIARVFIIFTLSLQVVFLLRIQDGTVVKNEEKIWQLNDRGSQAQLYNYINNLNEPFFVTVNDQISGFKSPWERRIDYAARLSPKLDNQNLLILSDYDSIMYKYANQKSPVSWANWRHAFFDWEFDEAISDMESGLITYVLVDIYPGTNMEPFSIHGTGLDQKVLGTITKHFELIETTEVGMVYSGLAGYDWYPSRLELYRFKKTQ